MFSVSSVTAANDRWLRAAAARKKRHEHFVLREASVTAAESRLARVGRIEEADRLPRREDDVAQAAPHFGRRRAGAEPSFVDEPFARKDPRVRGKTVGRGGQKLVGGAGLCVQVAEPAFSGLGFDQRCKL